MERSSSLAKHRAHRLSEERGAALFLALFALSAVGYASLRLITHVSAYSQLTRAHQDGIKHHTALRMAVTPILSEHRRCDVQHLSGHPIAGVAPRPQEWHVCTIGRPPFFSNQQALIPTTSPDYVTLFLNAKSCPTTRVATARSSFDAPFASFTCLLPHKLDGSLITHDNITVENSVISPVVGSQSTTIATPGSLIVSGTLTLSGHTLIVAGGEIKIPYVALHDAPNASVTVISAHGDIVIERIAGGIKLLALGRRALSVPRTQPPDSPPLPPLRKLSVSGIAPK